MVNSGHFCGREATFRCKNFLFSPNDFTDGHVLKIDWLVTNVTPVGCPDRGERAKLGMIMRVFWSIQATFVVGEPLCDVGVPPFEP